MIFVTGGTGLLGNCIVRELCERGMTPRVLCRAGTSRDAFSGLNLEIVEGDLGNADVLRRAISDCEFVIHSAALIHIGWQKLAESRLVNVEGTQSIVDACQSADAKLLHISTVDTLPAAINKVSPITESVSTGVSKTPCSYVVSKTESEQVVANAIQTGSVSAKILHPGFMLGPWDWKPSSGRMMLEVAKAPVAVAPPGGCSLCDARDVAKAICNAMHQGQWGEHYILAGENMDYQTLWTKMLETAGKPRRVYRFGQVLPAVSRLLSPLERRLPFREGDVNGAALQMGALNHYYDSSKAERELEYTRRSIEETLVDAWNWLQRFRPTKRSTTK